MVMRQDASTGQLVGTPAASAVEDDNTDKMMRAKVYSPYKVYFDQQIYSISAENDTGRFDILPSHHNFITLLKPSEISIQTPRGEQRIRISGGIMHVKSDRVIVFLDV